MRINITSCFLLLGFMACTSQKKLAKPAEPMAATSAPAVTAAKTETDIEKAAGQFLLSDSNLATAHLGISIYDPAEKKYLYNYQGDKYFIPASNTKLLTCYAAMKYLGDSLVGLRYEMNEDNSSVIDVEFNGDPTFLHPDFKMQPVFDFLKSKSIISIGEENWKENELGYGWSWNDYNEDYMAERSLIPLYGNVVSFSADAITLPSYFQKNVIGDISQKSFSVKREISANRFIIKPSKRKFTATQIPFHTTDANFIINLLVDTLKSKISFTHVQMPRWGGAKIIHSQPTDSLLKITMHRSDNFFAEQTLLMVSNERLGVMSDAAIIDTLLKTDYKAMPQKPKWVDGSGLSRYNLISPQDFVFVLEKMKNEFAWNRITTILPTGNSGTLAGLYKNYVGKIYAKTGTVSNNLALSGYIITNQNKQLIFSVMVNNHQASATAIRKSIEKFITDIIEKY